MSLHIPTAHEIETYTGRYVNTGEPEPETIDLKDIAHGLALTCRFGGHVKRFYSVAEHAVFCSRRLERQKRPLALQLAALHHDDAEAYLGDIPRPMKKLIGPEYMRMTERMDAAIWHAIAEVGEDMPLWYVADFHTQDVKDADNFALFIEARQLLKSRGRGWAEAADNWDLDMEQAAGRTPTYWLGGLDPDEAETEYIERHHELSQARLEELRG